MDFSGLGSIIGGLIGGNPYDSASDTFGKYLDKAVGAQNPFYNAGVGAIGNYQNWSNQMSNPTDFINNLMKNYQASPYSQFLQQQALRAGNNFGSANGLTGSSALAQQMQQNAGNIASQDMNQWLKNVLGINSTYGASQGNLMKMGADSANMISALYGNAGDWLGQTNYGSQAYDNSMYGNLIGGALQLGAGLL